ncbi:hypothetical protein BHM03_00024930 [Ensete ventricosum]|nr:hypothetical protein BHM03_00024930 [Ensete ventricosum]
MRGLNCLLSAGRRRNGRGDEWTENECSYFISLPLAYAAAAASSSSSSSSLLLVPHLSGEEPPQRAETLVARHPRRGPHHAGCLTTGQICRNPRPLPSNRRSSGAAGLAPDLVSMEVACVELRLRALAKVSLVSSSFSRCFVCGRRPSWGLTLVVMVVVVFVRGEENDKPGAVVRLRGTARDRAAGGEPRRLLPPRAQRAGKDVTVAFPRVCSAGVLLLFPPRFLCSPGHAGLERTSSFNGRKLS